MSFLIDNFLNFLFYLDTGWGIVTFVFFYIIWSISLFFYLTIWLNY